MENGGRVPLGEDKIAEVFLAPYPPDWQTDLNLFLLNREDFHPVTDVKVDLEYEMVYMDHGIDAQIGTRVADGHYVLPLSFLMYGDWMVDVTAQLPEGKKSSFHSEVLPVRGVNRWAPDHQSIARLDVSSCLCWGCSSSEPTPATKQPWPTERS